MMMTSDQRPTPSELASFSRDNVLARQRRLLRSMLEALWDGNRFYRTKFAGLGLDPADFNSENLLSQLPMTTKTELVNDQEERPLYGSNLTYPLDSYVRLHQTSGTTGRPLRWLDTAESWNWHLYLWEIIYHFGGLRSVIPTPMLATIRPLTRNS